MSERFAIGAQGAGLVTFKEPVSVSSAGPITQTLTIPEGMINIGGNGRGYMIEEQTYTFSPSLTEGSYVVYANDPVDASGNGDGIAELDHQEYSVYINGAGHVSPSKIYHGDTNSRRAFCYFQVDSSSTIIESTVRTITSFAYEEQQEYLERIGFYNFGHYDTDFTYRGQYWDEDVSLASASESWDSTGVTDWLLVYKENYSGSARLTSYNLGDKILEDEREWICDTSPSGTTAAVEPTWSSVTTVGDTITDGSVEWKLLGKPFGYFDKCISDNATYPEREVVVGVAEKDRDSTSGNNFVINSGLVDLGTTYLPNDEYPLGTFLYLTDTLSHLQTGRPSKQTSGAAAASLLPVGNIVRDIDYWQPSIARSEGDLIIDDNSTIHVWKCTTSGTSGATCPDFVSAGTTIDEFGVTGSTVADGTVTWTCEAVYNQQNFKGRKIRIGVSLGHGTILLDPGFSGSLIDDHDETATAHPIIQEALNKAGIYPYNQNQGVTDFKFRGQAFDEKATFDTVTDAVVDYDLVYLNSADGKYYTAINSSANLDAARVIGMAYGVSAGSGTVLSHGFIEYDASSWNDGDVLYLSKTSAGGMTNTASGADNISVGTVINAASIANGGYIHLNVGGGSSGVSTDYADYSVDEGATTSGISNSEVCFVYRNSAGNYQKAINDSNDLPAGKVIGIAYSVDTNRGDILTNGFVDFDTTSGNAFCDTTCSVGDTLYLSWSTAGGVTNVRQQTNNIKVGTVVTAGTPGVIYVDIAEESEFKDNAIDYEATFDSSVNQYDIVYGRDDSGLEYNQAIADGTEKETFLGVAYEVDTLEGIVVTQGFVDMGTDTTTGSGSNAGSLGYLANLGSPLVIGDKVYLSTVTAGLLSKDQTTTEVGKYVGTKSIGGSTHYIMLLSSTGGGGTGDVTAEDLVYLNLLNSEPFSLIYYDIFTEVNSLDYTSGVTYAANTSSYTGSSTDKLGNIIVEGDESAYATSTAYSEDDLQYETVQGWVWKCVVPGTSHVSYEPEWDFIGLSSTSLEAFYTMDRKDGTLATGQTISSEIDTSAGHKMTITGAAVTEDSSGKSDNAFVFDGTAYLLNDDSASGTLGDDLGTADPLSVSFWFKVDTLPTAGNYGGLFEIGDGTSQGEFSIYLSENTIEFDMSGGTNIGSYSFTDNLNWHHIYAEYDGTAGTAKLYLDGNVVISNSHSTDPVCTAQNVYLANFYDSVTASALVPFEGRLDEFRIYSRTLSSTERNYLNDNAGEQIYKGARITDYGGTLIWEAYRPRTLYRFFVYHEADATADLTVEYSTDYIGTDLTTGSWTDITSTVFDKDTILDTSGFTKLAIKYTYGGSGDLNSFGVLYGYYDDESYTTEPRLFEIYLNSTGSALSTGDIITLPNSAHYTLGNNSLRVTTLSGVRLFESTATNTYHYTEHNNRQIMLDDFTLNNGDSIVFEADYGKVDTSVVNYNTLQVEHIVDTTDSYYGQHIFEDTVTGQEWRPTMVSGALVFVPYS